MPGNFDRYGKSSSQNVYTAIVESCVRKVDVVDGYCTDKDGNCVGCDVVAGGGGG